MADEGLALNLRILSPSTEVEGGVRFPDLPASTTVRELRSRIQDAVPSKPATDRMRLIYRGRVVANDDSTLRDVFGAESIRESKDQSLHLVLRELPTSGTATSSASPSPAPRASTVPPPNPFRPAQAPTPASPALQTNPFRTLPQPRPESQPQLQPHHHHHHHPHPHVHHHHQLPGPPNQFQVPLPPAIQQQIAQTMAMGQAAAFNNGQPIAPQGQQPDGRTATPDNGAHPNPMGLPPLPGFPPQNVPQNGRTVRQEGIGPNGERWSVTTFTTANMPVGGQPQQPNILPPTFPPNPTLGSPTPLPHGIVPLQPSPAQPRERVLTQLRAIVDRARLGMGNVRTLLQAEQQNPPSPSSDDNSDPTWRLDEMRRNIREMQQSLDLIERGVSILGADAPNAPDVLALRNSAYELRGQLIELTQSIPSTAGPSEQSTGQNLPPGLPEELFLLYSPQGPVGVLFNQQGTFMTAPMTSSLPFQTFTDQFARNRQIISGLGQHMAHNAQLQNQIASTRITTAALPTNTGHNGAAHPQAQNQAQQGQPQNQGQDRDQNANPQGENDRIGNIAGHLWLLVKLAFFVYFLSGSGGWYKSIALGVVAGGIYLAQLGIFDQHFNVVRRHFEAVLPVGALAERVMHGRNANAQAQRVEPGRNLTPEEAARRLLEQQNNDRFGWARETLRTVERAFAIFIASLWPGIGERMVHAQEERERAERVAEEERQRQIEEAQRQEAEAQQANEEKKDGPEIDNGDVDEASGSKGKEPAEAVKSEEASAEERVQ